MGQGGRLRQRRVEHRRWRTDGRAQRAIQRVARTSRFVIALHHQLHAASAGTDQVHAMRVDDGRCNGHAHRQHKPHQQEAGELEGVTQALHAWNYVSALEDVRAVCLF